MKWCDKNHIRLYSKARAVLQRSQTLTLQVAVVAFSPGHVRLTLRALFDFNEELHKSAEEAIAANANDNDCSSLACLTRVWESSQVAKIGRASTTAHAYL